MIAERKSDIIICFMLQRKNKKNLMQVKSMDISSGLRMSRKGREIEDPGA